MLKLSRHGITFLNQRYRAVMKHCLMVNIALIMGGGIAFAETVDSASNNTFTGNNTYMNGSSTLLKIDVTNNNVSADNGYFNVQGGGTSGYTQVKNTLYVGDGANKLQLTGTKIAANNGASTTFSVDGATGNTTVGGTLGVTGNTTVGGTLGVTGNTTVGGTLGVTGNTTVGGQVSASTASINGGNFNVTTGYTQVKNTLYVGDEGNRLQMSGSKMESQSTNGTVGMQNGKLYAKDSSNNETFSVNAANGNITSTGDATIGGNATINGGKFNVRDGYTEIQDQLYVGTGTDRLQMTGTKIASTYTETSGTTTTVSIENGNISAKNKTGTTSIKTFSVDGETGNTTVGGKLSVTGKATFSDDLAVTGNETVGGTLGVTGKATLKGGLALSDSGPTVTSIDDGTTAVTATTGSDTALATTATVMKSAENATFTNTGTLNLTSATTLNGAITTLDAKLGDVSSVSVNGFSGSDLTSAVSKLDSNMGSVLGSIYANDGTYNALSDNGFKAGTDLTAQLSDYAANVQTATGGRFAPDGTWSATVDNTTAAANGYSYIASTNIMDAVNQVAANVGTADQLTTTGKNGVLTSNSVNSNLDALNKVIGDITTLNDGTTANTGNALSNGTGTTPTTVVAALNNIDATLGTIHGLATKLSNAGSYQGNLASGTTVEQHLTALDTAIGNRTYTNQYNVTTGESVAASIDKIDTAMGNVASLSGTHYASGATNLTDGIKSLDNKLYSLSNEVHDLRSDFEAGMAAAAALSALVPNARAAGNTQLSFGTGGYQGHTAMAMGGFHWFNDNVLVNAGVAWDNREATYRMGITYSW